MGAADALPGGTVFGFFVAGCAGGAAVVALDAFGAIGDGRCEGIRVGVAGEADAEADVEGADVEGVEAEGAEVGVLVRPE